MTDHLDDALTVPRIRFALFGIEKVSIKGRCLVDSGQYSLAFELLQKRPRALIRYPYPIPAAVPFEHTGVNPKGYAAVGSLGEVTIQGEARVDGPIICAGKQISASWKNVDTQLERMDPEYSRKLPRLSTLLKYVPDQPVSVNAEVNAVAEGQPLNLAAGYYHSVNGVMVNAIMGLVNLFIVDSPVASNNESIVLSCMDNVHYAPAHLRVWYHGNRDVKIGKPGVSPIFWGLVYAPNSRVILGPEPTSICGAVVAKEILIEGNSRIAFDLNLVQPAIANG